MRGSLADRLEEKITRVPESGCWLFTGSINALGYGRLQRGVRGQGIVKAHRAAWEIYRGAIPAGMNVLHACDVPACCNPAHLFLGTIQDNNVDCRQKGRHRSNPPKGEANTEHKLTEEEVAAIRQACAAGSASMSALALAHGVSRQTIWRIVRGRAWKHSLDAEAA